METAKAIIFVNARKYPLSPIPLSIRNADGTKRRTNKSTLQKIILKYSSNNVVLEIVRDCSEIFQIPETYEGLAWQLIKLLPSGYKRIDTVAHT